jgi:hypothetical protein
MSAREVQPSAGPSSGETNGSAEVFISYSRRDSEFVGRLVELLEQKGRRCWVDWQSIRPSAEWMREVTAAIDAAQAFVFVLSPDSATSKVCRQELDRALAVNKRIIPILVRDVDAVEVAQAITERNWLFFREGDDGDRSLELLLRALDTDPAWAATHTRLLVRAVEWERSGRNSSYVLRGQDLRAAEAWLTEADPQKDPQPTQLHTEYVIASRNAATRAQRIRTAILAVGLVTAVALAVVALVQRGRAEDQAKVARSRELAAKSLLTSATNPGAALSQAVEAGDIEPTSEAAQALRLGLEGTSSLERVLPVDAPLEDLAYSADGSLIATADDDGQARIWETASGEQVTSLATGAQRVLDLDFSDDRRLLALAAGT